MKVDDSKKAFPSMSNKDLSHKGMSLYEYYIGKAISGLMANPNFNPLEDSINIAELARVAHKMAVAQLKHKEDNYVQ